jgi:hypothetical protein
MCKLRTYRVLEALKLIILCKVLTGVYIVGYHDRLLPNPHIVTLPLKIIFSSCSTVYNLCGGTALLNARRINLLIQGF